MLGPKVGGIKVDPTIRKLQQLIKKGDEQGANQVIEGMRDQLEARFGSDIFMPEGLFRRPARSKLFYAASEGVLFDRVMAALGDKAMARTVADGMLLLPGVGLVIDALNGIGDAPRRESPLVQFRFQVEDRNSEPHVTFLQPQGMSFQKMANVIDAESQRVLGRKAIVPGVLRSDEPVETVPTESVAHEFTMVLGTKDKTRGEQKICLANKGMVFTKYPVVVIGAALYLLQNGVKEIHDSQGNLTYKGSLFDEMQGTSVRCDGGSVGFNGSQIANGGYYDGDRCFDLFAAGSRSTRVWSA